MEQKNFLLAMALIIGFLLLWSTFVVPRFAPPPAPLPAGQAGVPAAQNVGTAVESPGTMAVTPAEMKSALAEVGETVVPPDTILHDENNEIVFSPKGGAVRDWRINSKGEEVDLVLNPEAEILPLASFPEAIFKITTGDRRAVMETTLANRLHVTKTLTLSSSGYLHQLSFRFQNPTSHPIELSNWEWGWGPGLGTAATEQKENTRNIRAITLGKLKVHVIKEADQPEFGRWAAIDNRYFLVAFIPKQPHAIDLGVTGSKTQTRIRLIESTTIPAKGEATLEYELYVGPKGFTQLKKYGLGLEESVDFGYFSSLGRLVLDALYYLKAVTGNYGVAIIILTIVIQILMAPLTIKSFKATLAMKKLQPKIAEIQARFKGDPKRLNIEMMNVYKSTGTNPFGGCLPMLLQLPIFWALFTTLRNAYELRGEPFVGWIRDLSTPDVLFHAGGVPVHALPLVMGGAMYFQQKMSGAASDPTQKQMMLMMPIMFTFMFYGFPSGLVLYWLTNNLMTMAFQWSFQRFSKSPSGVIETTIVK
jgi:YidC/Oxa1 family membrane protein insertase